jgi:predicted nuclease of predicted toxin-antitoxin system
MKVLLDTCVWGGAAESLQAAGHEVRWTGEMETDPGDEAILTLAFQESRVMVTLDKDFGELAIVRGMPHVGIIRLVDISAEEQGPLCAAALGRYGQELARGAIVTIEPGRVRVRPSSI